MSFPISERLKNKVLKGSAHQSGDLVNECGKTYARFDEIQFETNERRGNVSISTFYRGEHVGTLVLPYYGGDIASISGFQGKLPVGFG